ncbi:hypothetical protein SAMN04488505_104427 [Chitinophaga rupis]|uniref:HEAT repeat-containing protein n=1 Tax=Chitinophaga rupis TaxID=573321 RepID=A0A1H7YEJ5_9BACT|nr:DUF6493 family protein [Chitinophaga rupis]SEM44662.1 hypothetical protein SAMN04488505_104427 [Chitinophaga rupis]
MDLQQEFTTILEKERKDEVWAFLKGLDQTQKKAFTPFLKTTAKDYLDYREVKESGSQSSIFMQKATPVQREILRAAGFVCCTRQEIEKIFFGILDEEILEQVLDWYCPDWLNAYVNDLKGDHIPLNYLSLVKLWKQGHIDPVPALIARQLPMVIHNYEGPNRSYQFTVSNLLIYDITLTEHIWYLFQFESSVNWSGRYLATDAAQKTWIDVFREFSAAGKLDRQRILKEALLASNRGFNKTLSGWFAELFTEMEPAIAELQTLQPELLVALSAAHTKPVNTALQCLKKLADEKQLDTGSFLDHTGILLSSTTKAVLTNTLAVLEKLLKQDKQLAPAVCAALCQVFMNNDDDVQSRAAKLLKKYGNAADPALREQIAQYRETMMVSARSLLPDFMEPVTGTPVPGNILEVPEAYNLLDEQVKIEDISGFDELIFLASQAFDNNQPYHIYLLPAALIKLHTDITGEQVKKLEPAFQRAYKLVMKGAASAGELDVLLAIFWIDYGRYLVQQFPGETASIRSMHESNVKQDEAFHQQYPKWYTRRMRTLKEWSNGYKGDLCGVYLFFLITALDKITSGDTLPLLCTPTHAPGWLSPVELTERLYQYQQANTAPDEMDLQMALSRLVLDTPAPGLSYAAEKLTGEYLRIMQFILEKDARPQPPFQHASWWMIAALAKTPLVIYPEFEHFPYNKVARSRFTGQYAWQTIAEERFTDEYDYEKKKNVKQAYLHKELQVIGINKQDVQAATPHLLYEYIILGDTGSLFTAPNDMQRMLFFTPNNPEPLLAHVVSRCLQYEKFWDETAKKVVLNTIQTLHGLQRPWSSMGHLFIATCLVSSDKTIAQIAAEIWINGVTRGLINSHQLGEVIGKHQVVEFTPLKRFTDLVMNNLIRLSDQHNRELEKMIGSLLAHLPEEPIKNLKKLLEIYMEVLSINHSLITTAWIREQLQAWSLNDGLSKVTKQLLTKYV